MATNARSSRALVPAQKVQLDIVTITKAYEAAADQTYKEIAVLIKNGMYYQTVNNPVSALVSYSNAATYLHALGNPQDAPVLSMLLGYIEALQEKVRGLGMGGKKDDEESNWDSLCINMCELDSNSLCLTFADVVGMQKEKNLMEVNIIKPLVYKNLYTKSSKGVLLYGPPGTGKTYLVKAAIRELQNRFKDQVQVLFFSKTGADLKGKYVGETEKRIVEVYTCAARRACEMTDLTAQVKGCGAKSKEAQREEFKEGDSPQYVSVIFIDEFDSIGRDRSADETGLAANAVNTLLQMMDGVESYKNVITIAATNNPWDLDAALLRRFNEHIYVKLPKFDDIKTLVKREMVDRFKLVTTNMLAYCGSRLADPKKRIYKPSVETIQKYEKSWGKDDASCKTTNTEVFPLDKIDISYQFDTSEDMMNAITEMSEKHYSNSDVSSVMQKAFNSVSEKCLQLGGWKKITDFEDVKQTDGTVKQVPKQSFYVSNFTKLVKGFDQNTTLDAANQAIETIAAKPNDGTTNDILDYSKGDIFFDIQEFIKRNPFDVSDKIVPLEKRNKVMTNIRVGTDTYINLKFIKDPPTYLLFNDNSIDEIFINTADIRTVLDKTSSIRVIFTKVMSMTNDPSKMGITDKNQVQIYESQLYKLNKLDVTDKEYYDNDSLELFAFKIKSILDILYEYQTDLPHDYYNMEDIREKYGTVKTNGTVTETGPGFAFNVDANYILSGWNIDKFVSSIKPFIDANKPVVSWYLVGTNKLHDSMSFKLLNEYIAKAKTIITTRRDALLVKTEPKPDDIMTVKKLVFFRSIIKPKSGEWALSRANSSWVIKNIKGAAKGLYDSIVQKLSGKPEEKDTTVGSYLSKVRTSAIDYLLARATSIGICTGHDDVAEFYKDIANCSSIPTKLLKRGGSRKQRVSRNKTFRIKRAANKDIRHADIEIDESIQQGGGSAQIYWHDIDQKERWGTTEHFRNILAQRIPSTLHIIAGFENETDLPIQNLITKAMFTTEYFFIEGSLKDKLEHIDEAVIFDSMFKYNFEAGIKRQNYTFWTSAIQPVTFENSKPVRSNYNVKCIKVAEDVPDYNTFLSFYVDGSFLSGAIAEYPSTYNEKIVNMLNIYDSNRADFYARRDKGEFDKKK